MCVSVSVSGYSLSGYTKPHTLPDLTMNKIARTSNRIEIHFAVFKHLPFYFYTSHEVTRVLNSLLLKDDFMSK